MARVGLVHGLGGTAATMAPLARVLTAHGHDCESVTLPGHGATPIDLARTTWAEWLAAVPHAPWLVGQSLGGALALAAAATRGDVAGVVTINSPFPDPDALDGLEWRQSRGIEWIDDVPLAEGEAGYTRLPTGAFVEMTRGLLAVDLAAIRVPVVLVSGALDGSVDPAGTDAMAAAIAGPTRRLMLPASGHTATFGPDLELLAEAVDDLCRSGA
jgi:carboxylesterase